MFYIIYKGHVKSYFEVNDSTLLGSPLSTNPINLLYELPIPNVSPKITCR